MVVEGGALVWREDRLRCEVFERHIHCAKEVSHQCPPLTALPGLQLRIRLHCARHACECLRGALTCIVLLCVFHASPLCCRLLILRRLVGEVRFAGWRRRVLTHVTCALPTPYGRSGRALPVTLLLRPSRSPHTSQAALPTRSTRAGVCRPPGTTAILLPSCASYVTPSIPHSPRSGHVRAPSPCSSFLVGIAEIEFSSALRRDTQCARVHMPRQARGQHDSLDTLRAVSRAADLISAW